MMETADWPIVDYLAAQLTLRKADRNVIEKVVHYLINHHIGATTTQAEQIDAIKKWLYAYEQDGFLGARSRQTWDHHRTANLLVKILLETFTVEQSARTMAWITRKMVFYRENVSLARQVVQESRMRAFELPELDMRTRPPTMSVSAHPQKKAVEDEIPEAREEVSDLARLLEKKLREKGNEE
jgi:hypothetical protein